MASLPSARLVSSRLRTARVGEVLPSSVVVPASRRGVESAAVLLPGAGSLDDYVAALESAETEFRHWDGRVVIEPPDGLPKHRLLIVDRYGQVYWTGEADAQDGLLPPDELREWFKFLATACPECGVLDDPTDRDWVP